MKLAFLATDVREHIKDYANPVATFGTAPGALLQGFAGMPDLEVHVISCTQQPVKSQEKIADNIWFHSLHVPKIGWLKTFYQGCVRAVRKELRELQPDLVHGQGTERDCALSAVFSGWPNVLTIHGNMRLIARVENATPFSYTWIAARLERFTLPRADGIVCITHYTQQAVSSLARRTWVWPNATDQKFFAVDAQPDPRAAPIILCVGAVTARKNQNAFIRALDPLAAQHRFQIVFLGQAPRGLPYSDEFFQLLESRPWCSYAGFADREKLRTHFQTASLLALPSLEDNCPMAVLEAMAAGVPALAANVGGVPDLIEEGRNGLLCDPLDATSMRGAVARFLEDPVACRGLALRAKQDALARFSPRVVAQKHLEFYREILQRP